MMGKKKNERNGLRSHLFSNLRRKSPATQASNEKPEMTTSPVLNISHPPPQGVVAQVILNGYNINHEMSWGSLGAMRSFKIVDGDLWDEWNEQTAVVLSDRDGQKTWVKIAALPVDADSLGLIEFVLDAE